MTSDFINRLKKLLRLSADKGATEAEAASALALVQKLLEAHNLSMVDIKGEPETQIDNKLSADWVKVGEVELKWFGYLVWKVAGLNMCHAIVTNGNTQSTIVGHKVNIEVTKEMVEWLRGQLYILAGQALNKERAAGRRTDLLFVQSFLKGATERICQRLKDLQDSRLAQSVQTRALVVSRKTEVERHFTLLFPRVSKIQTGRLNESAYHSGREAGDKAGLTPQSRQVNNGRLLLT